VKSFLGTQENYNSSSLNKDCPNWRKGHAERAAVSGSNCWLLFDSFPEEVFFSARYSYKLP